jgi:hypothetical protein
LEKQAYKELWRNAQQAAGEHCVNSTPMAPVDMSGTTIATGDSFAHHRGDG